MTTKEISFLKPLEAAIALCDSFKSIVIKSADDYTAAEAKRKQAREFKAALLVAYNSHQTVIDAKNMQIQKKALEERLDAFNKDVKSGPMAKYEAEQEAIRAAEERRLAAIAKAEADRETARQVAEQKRIFEANEAIRKAAEAAQQKAQDALRAAKSAEAQQKAKEDAAKAQEAARVAQEAAEQARAEATQIKADAAATPAPVVVLEKTTPTVSRRKVYRWRLTTKDGRKYLKAEMTVSTRLKIADIGPLPAELFILSPVLLNEWVDSQGEIAAIPNVLEIRSEMV